jgi:uncharacterized RDD family membrane protein YckC
MRNGATGQLAIRTPEGIVFSLRLAGPVARCLAWMVDLSCVIGIVSVLATVLGLLGWISPDFVLAMNVLAYFAVSYGYGIALEWLWRGQTVGKRLLRLRVLDRQGFRLRFSQIVIRNLLRAVDGLPVFYLVGGVACLVSRHAQRLGDLAAGTIVIRSPKLAEPDLSQLAWDKFNSLLAWPHLAARLRQAVTPAEAALALEALLNRDTLELEARLGLFHDLAAHFRAKVVFPQEATDGLSDEQYLRNVVEVVFPKQTG